jgi:hypothetical protein
VMGGELVVRGYPPGTAGAGGYALDRHHALVAVHPIRPEAVAATLEERNGPGHRPGPAGGGGETRTPLRPLLPPEVRGCRRSDLGFDEGLVTLLPAVVHGLAFDCGPSTDQGQLSLTCAPAATPAWIEAWSGS